MACISGANGSGKSSLFDAITWALFGKARRSDDALINDAAESCLVALEFDYEDNRYRVQREKPRGKGALLELQIRTEDGGWKALTEAGRAPDRRPHPRCAAAGLRHFHQRLLFPAGQGGYVHPAGARAAQRDPQHHSGAGDLGGLQRGSSRCAARNAADEVKNLRAWLDEVLAELDEEAERTEKLRLLSLSLEKTSALRG